MADHWRLGDGAGSFRTAYDDSFFIAMADAPETGVRVDIDSRLTT
jgi:hypothetical protein